MLVTAWLLTATLMRMHQTAPMADARGIRADGKMVLLALPLAVLMFLFFPRLPGQFWAVPARASAATGLDDEMSPGDVSDLSLSGAIAFRVKFEGEAAAAPRALLARSGAARLRWTHLAPAASSSCRSKPVIAEGPVYRYDLTLRAEQSPLGFRARRGHGLAARPRRADVRPSAHGERAEIATMSTFTLESQTAFRFEGRWR